MTTNKGMTKKEMIQLCKEYVDLIGSLNVAPFYAHYYGGGVKDSTLMSITKSVMMDHLLELVEVFNKLREERLEKEAAEEKLAMYIVEFQDDTELTLYGYSREDAMQEAEKRAGKEAKWAYFVKFTPGGEKVVEGRESVKVQESVEESVPTKGKVSMHNVDDGKWQVINEKAGKHANIYAINEYNAFSTSKKRYRVDVDGVTVASLIDHFQTAKSIASKHVQ